MRSGLSGLGVTLLRSVSVNLAELRRAQTLVGKEDWLLGIGYWGLVIGEWIAHAKVAKGGNPTTSRILRYFEGRPRRAGGNLV